MILMQLPILIQALRAQLVSDSRLVAALAHGAREVTITPPPLAASSPRDDAWKRDGLSYSRSA